MIKFIYRDKIQLIQIKILKLNFIKFKMIFMQIKCNLSDKIKFKKKKKDGK